MTTIAHISDLHLLEDRCVERSVLARLRLSLLCFGRPIDPAERRARLERALDTAWRRGADHLVVTGDLTEDGLDAQFAVLGRVLARSRWPSHRVTLVPGNHDAYADDSAWSRALAGPLAAFEPTSAPCAVTRVGEAAVVALSTAFQQPLLRAAGRIGDIQRRRLQILLASGGLRDRTVVLAQHHAPMRRPGFVEWIDGLEDRQQTRELLASHANAHVLCGHAHRAADLALGSGQASRVFVADAVADHPNPVRFYEAWRGQLRPLESALDRDAAGRVLVHALADSGFEA